MEKIKLAWHILSLAKELMPVIKDIIAIIKGVIHTQRNAPALKGEDKKEHCKINLHDKEINEKKYKELDKGVDFIKDILKVNKVFEPPEEDMSDASEDI